jgi:hypothetical protein
LHKEEDLSNIGTFTVQRALSGAAEIIVTCAKTFSQTTTEKYKANLYENAKM